MGRGRPPKPGTAEEKAAARRERVRNNVRALRERRKQEATANKASVDSVVAHEQDEDGYTESSGSSVPLRSGGESEGSRQSSSEPSTVVSSSDHVLVRHQGIRRSSLTPVLPASVDTKSPYALALLATVREMFLPDSIHLPSTSISPAVRPWDSQELLWTPCAFWITSAFTRASNQDASLLKTGLLSIGMLIKSVENQDQSLRIASMEMYRRSLQGIRFNLESLIRGSQRRPKDSVGLYLACHAAAMFELVQNSDLSATMRHLRGVSQLICHLGDGCDEEGQSIAWLLLQDYRFAEMGLCMKFRYASYSSIARRQFEKESLVRETASESPTPAKGRDSRNMLVTLTDIADEISAVMVVLDSLKIRLTHPETPMRLRRVLEDLDQIWQTFPLLHNRLVEVHGKAFIFRNPDDEGPGKGSYRFKTFDIGAAWCYNLMTQLYCLETSIETTSLLLDVFEDSHPDASTPDSKKSPSSDSTTIESLEEFATADRLQELRRLHRAICIQLTQCLLYFLQTDKGITGQALSIYPLDAALNMLTVEMERLKLDFKQASFARKGGEQINMILRDIASIGNAKMFVEKMQERAKQFGLPSFLGMGSANFTSDKPRILAAPD